MSLRQRQRHRASKSSPYTPAAALQQKRFTPPRTVIRKPPLSARRPPKQSTLTQLDFVNQREILDSDDEDFLAETDCGPFGVGSEHFQRIKEEDGGAVELMKAEITLPAGASGTKRKRNTHSDLIPTRRKPLTREILTPTRKSLLESTGSEPLVTFKAFCELEDNVTNGVNSNM